MLCRFLRSVASRLSQGYADARQPKKTRLQLVDSSVVSSSLLRMELKVNVVRASARQPNYGKSSITRIEVENEDRSKKEDAWELEFDQWYGLTWEVEDKDAYCRGASVEFRLCGHVCGACDHGEPTLVIMTDVSFQRSLGRGMDLLLHGVHKKADFRVDSNNGTHCDVCNPVYLQVTYFPCTGKAPAVTKIPLYMKAI